MTANIDPAIKKALLRAKELLSTWTHHKDLFGTAMISKDYDKAEEISKRLIKTVAQVHAIFEYDASTMRGISDWRADKRVKRNANSLQERLDEIKRSNTNRNIPEFVNAIERAENTMKFLFNNAAAVMFEGPRSLKEAWEEERDKATKDEEVRLKKRRGMRRSEILKEDYKEMVKELIDRDKDKLKEEEDKRVPRWFNAG
jgi:hypothetical protein